MILSAESQFIPYFIALDVCYLLVTSDKNQRSLSKKEKK